MTPPSLPHQHEAIASRRWGRTYLYISLIALRSFAQVTHHDPPVWTLCGHKNAISHQICSARSSRSVHPNPRDETHLFGYSAKSLDIAGLHHKNPRYIGSATHQSTLATPVASMCDPTGSKTVSRDHDVTWQGPANHVLEPSP